VTTSVAMTGRNLQAIAFIASWVLVGDRRSLIDARPDSTAA